jgi:DNA-directed RNA polymerase subunit K/omega
VRGSYSGNTLAFQANAESSILLPRSSFLKEVIMKVKAVSRGTEIDIEKCVENSGNDRFSMILALAARAREISRQHKNSESKEHIYPCVTALKEFENSEFTLKEYLKKVR